MGDPEGALTHTRNVIKKDDDDGSGSDNSSNNSGGTCMIVEPFAQNELEKSKSNSKYVLCCLYANMYSKLISFQWTCTGSTSRRKQNKRCRNE